MNFTLNSQAHPPRHEKYLIQKDRFLYTATPCYGLHKPWWVIMNPNGEIEPIPMESTDKWIKLSDAIIKLT